jgi:hypothetical protein
MVPFLSGWGHRKGGLGGGGIRGPAQTLDPCPLVFLLPSCALPTNKTFYSFALQPPPLAKLPNGCRQDWG